jgi:hypothetical protein
MPVLATSPKFDRIRKMVAKMKLKVPTPHAGGTAAPEPASVTATPNRANQAPWNKT